MHLEAMDLKDIGDCAALQTFWREEKGILSVFFLRAPFVLFGGADDVCFIIINCVTLYECKNDWGVEYRSP